MILSDGTIASLCRPPEFLNVEPMIVPFFYEEQDFHGLSYGLSPASYSIRVKQDVTLLVGEFLLASSVEMFNMPDDVLGIVHDKSTLARHGLSVFNTIIQPGFKGFLTLELKNQGNNTLTLTEGCPIAQIVFHRLDRAALAPYRGKYQNQEDRPVEAIRKTG